MRKPHLENLMGDTRAATRLRLELQNRSFMAKSGCRESARQLCGRHPMIRHGGKDVSITKLLTATYLGCEVDEIPKSVSWIASCKNPRCIDLCHGKPNTK